MSRRPGFLASLLAIVKAKPRVPASLADNELLRVILNRRSVRRFLETPIPEDVFAAILEAGRLAPSTVNLQSWAFAALDGEEWRQVFGRPIPFHGSRAVIVIADAHRPRLALGDFPSSPLVDHTVAVMNASLAAMNMNIAAEALGVSSVMLSETGRTGLLDAGYLKEKLSLPDGAVPLMTIVFGYASGAYPPMPPKLPPEQIFFKGTYRAPDPEILTNWRAQMEAGFKTSHILSSFEKQIQVYRSKIEAAEAELNQMVFHK